MGVEIVCPAPLHDYSALMFPSGVGGIRAFKGAMLQLVGGPTVGLYIDGRCMAVLGFFPLVSEQEGEGLFEYWEVNSPEAGRHMVALMRATKLTLQRILQSGRVRLRARIYGKNHAGQRMARMCGMSKVEDFGVVQVWEISS